MAEVSPVEYPPSCSKSWRSGLKNFGPICLGCGKSFDRSQGVIIQPRGGSAGLASGGDGVFTATLQGSASANGTETAENKWQKLEIE